MSQVLGEREYECPHCRTVITDVGFASITEQMSKGGGYCEECIKELDTAENRFRWLTDNDLQAKFLEWFFSDEDDREFDAEQRATAKLFVDMWQKAQTPRHWASEFDGFLKDYINADSGYAYTQWLLDTN